MEIKLFSDDDLRWWVELIKLALLLLKLAWECLVMYAVIKMLLS